MSSKSVKYKYSFWLLIVLCNFSMPLLNAQETIDSVVVPGFNDSNEVDVEDQWIDPDTIFNNIHSLPFPGNSIEVRHIPLTIIDSLKKNEAFWYADYEKKSPKINKYGENSDSSFLNNLLNQQWFKTFVWIVIIVGFLAVMVWYLAYSNISLFKPAAKPIVTDEDHLPLNIFEINYNKEIDKAMSDENYRQAIRLMFLQLLKRMDENEIIKYQQDLTNFDYRMQLQGTHYEPPFKNLVTFYEYAWYGKWQPGKTIFMQVKEQFDTFNRELKNQ